MKIRLILSLSLLTFAAGSIASAAPSQTDVIKCGDDDKKKKDES
jgi:hypothetical protein